MSVVHLFPLKSLTLAVRDRFPGGQNIYLFSNSDTANFLLQTNVGERGPNFIFVVWVALYVVGWVIVA